MDMQEICSGRDQLAKMDGLYILGQQNSYREVSCYTFWSAVADL